LVWSSSLTPSRPMPSSGAPSRSGGRGIKRGAASETRRVTGPLAARK
jgi:hypothetical protein